MVVVALLSVYLVESVYLVSVDLVVNCKLKLKLSMSSCTNILVLKILSV